MTFLLRVLQVCPALFERAAGSTASQQPALSLKIRSQPFKEGLNRKTAVRSALTKGTITAKALIVVYRVSSGPRTCL